MGNGNGSNSFNVGGGGEQCCLAEEEEIDCNSSSRREEWQGNLLFLILDDIL